MVVISDNDAILKLAAFDLLDEAASLFGVPAAEVRVLDTARHLFRKRRANLAEKYTEAGVERAIAFVENASPITEAPDPNEVAILSAVERIDPGETVLFAATGLFADALLITGDKRALTALSESATAQSVFHRLAGRVVCLEAVIEGIIHKQGFDFVKGRILSAVECDTAIRAVFGSGQLAQVQVVLSGLNSYISDLEKSVGTDWLIRFEAAP